MLINYVTDLHLEFNSGLANVQLNPSDADVIVLSGDIGLTTPTTRDWLLKQTEGRRAVYCAGNHEFYNDEIDRVLDFWKRSLDGTHVSFLENDTVVIDGVSFSGATLWTDYELFGSASKGKSMLFAQLMMSDHKIIFKGKEKSRLNRFMPEDALERHITSKAFLEKALAESTTDKHVLVVHHGVCPQSVAPEFAGSDLNPAFASDLTDMIRTYQPDVIFHGHTHSSVDARIGKTRILCNPRGYDPHELNPNFDMEALVGV